MSERLEPSVGSIHSFNSFFTWFSLYLLSLCLSLLCFTPFISIKTIPFIMSLLFFSRRNGFRFLFHRSLLYYWVELSLFLFTVHPYCFRSSPRCWFNVSIISLLSHSFSLSFCFLLAFSLITKLVLFFLFKARVKTVEIVI